MKRLLILILKFYHKLLAPFLPPACKFYPSCSGYMIEAIEKHGILHGLILGIWRVLRCNPWNSGGYDPVP
ncbi:MAG: membrane protein insertion efficiency factor YidD [bacterium]|nr:membrane protein insertion efficiency factor YidD [bacterium]